MIFFYYIINGRTVFTSTMRSFPSDHKIYQPHNNQYLVDGRSDRLFLPVAVSQEYQELYLYDIQGPLYFSFTGTELKGQLPI